MDDVPTRKVPVDMTSLEEEAGGPSLEEHLHRRYEEKMDRRRKREYAQLANQTKSVVSSGSTAQKTPLSFGAPATGKKSSTMRASKSANAGSFGVSEATRFPSAPTFGLAKPSTSGSVAGALTINTPAPIFVSGSGPTRIPHGCSGNAASALPPPEFFRKRSRIPVERRGTDKVTHERNNSHNNNRQESLLNRDANMFSANNEMLGRRQIETHSDEVSLDFGQSDDSTSDEEFGPIRFSPIYWVEHHHKRHRIDVSSSMTSDSSPSTTSTTSSSEDHVEPYEAHFNPLNSSSRSRLPCRRSQSPWNRECGHQVLTRDVEIYDGYIQLELAKIRNREATGEYTNASPWVQRNTELCRPIVHHTSKLLSSRFSAYYI